MRNNTNIKLKDAIENAESYIEEMMLWEDKKLSKHIDLFREQMQMAYKHGNKAAFELLVEYERQTIVARANKE